MRVGHKPCSDGPKCQNRQLEHIFIFHFRGFNPQPRFFDIEKTKSSKNRYIGFHQTDPSSAILIAHSDFRISERYDSTMIGHMVSILLDREKEQKEKLIVVVLLYVLKAT